ncbi:hypothetical protein [Neisseria perflava]|uniref:hypothetical protein n=1 Tax=Neisseria perflava TaxID=33053 RepID=UPI00209F2DC9|nr:hypothetical protein [Neisseria perflava]MCP1661309.1 hypothetical protein [Neisseria perflava]MCP1773404.1 hypothetical protein [Neisseria perflava]
MIWDIYKGFRLYLLMRVVLDILDIYPARKYIFWLVLCVAIFEIVRIFINRNNDEPDEDIFIETPINPKGSPPDFDSVQFMKDLNEFNLKQKEKIRVKRKNE